jgi:glycosyltransferase involved in cell wall biosynthesis
MSLPLLSVIMPYYNQEIFLPVSLKAIFNQSFSNLELIVVDDASTDGGLEIIRDYQKRQANLYLYQNPHNLGPLLSANFGMTKARGKYLAFCAADDKVLPDFFEKAINALETYASAGLCVTDPVFFSDKGEEKQKMIQRTDRIFLEPTELIELFKKTNFWIPGHASIYRKDLIFKYQGLNLSLKHLSDWYLNHKIALKHGVVYIPEFLSSMRVNSTTFSSKINSNKKEKKKTLKALLNLLSFENDQKWIEQFKKAALLTQLGNDLFFFLVYRPKYWKYLSSFVCKKIRNVFFKIIKQKQKIILLK